MRGATPLLALPSYFRQISKRGRVPALYGFQVRGLLNPRNLTTHQMKLKKTRKTRKCYSCKSSINKGDLYGQRSITLGEKVDGKTETFDGTYFVTHQMRLPVSLCKTCMEAK
tara:strand:+ start:65 stop:400 length:336 start_codon:yes stop_codon:yes gene_type:complete